MPPNILFITDDQHRYDFLEMTGRFPVSTPNLARLAREGAWHHQAYSNCPLCMPARCSLHNGLYAHQHGMNQNLQHWPLGLPTMPQALQRAGYHTAAIGKLHVYEAVPERLDLTTVAEQVRSLGYDDLHECGGKALAYHVDCEWTHHMKRRGALDAYREDGEKRKGLADDARPFAFETEDYMDVYIGDHCVEWLETYDDDKPFFLWAGLMSPHPPYDAPKELFDKYPPEEQPAPVDNDDSGPWPVKRSLYAGMVEMVDRQVGRMLEVLERRGLLDDTLVLFTADHGEMLGDHGLAGKCYPYDPATRVPLLARWPGRIQPGTVCDGLVELTDLPATVLEAAGAEPVAEALPGSPGRSIAPQWSDASAPFREFIYSEDGGQFQPAYQMIRTDKWKYAFQVESLEETLFDMESDPDECENLAAVAEHGAVKESLKSRLLAHFAATPPPIRD